MSPALAVLAMIIIWVMYNSLNVTYNDKHKNELNYLAFDAGFDPEQTKHEFHGFSAGWIIILFCLFIALGYWFKTTL